VAVLRLPSAFVPACLGCLLERLSGSLSSQQWPVRYCPCTPVLRPVALLTSQSLPAVLLVLPSGDNPTDFLVLAG